MPDHHLGTPMHREPPRLAFPSSYVVRARLVGHDNTRRSRRRIHRHDEFTMLYSPGGLDGSLRGTDAARRMRQVELNGRNRPFRVTDSSRSESQCVSRKGGRGSRRPWVGKGREYREAGFAVRELEYIRVFGKLMR